MPKTITNKEKESNNIPESTNTHEKQKTNVLKKKRKEPYLSKVGKTKLLKLLASKSLRKIVVKNSINYPLIHSYRNRWYFKKKTKILKKPKIKQVTPSWIPTNVITKVLQLPIHEKNTTLNQTTNKAETLLLRIFDTEKGYNHEAIANEISILNNYNYDWQHEQQTYLTIKQAPTSTEMNWDLYEASESIPPTLSKPSTNTFEETKLANNPSYKQEQLNTENFIKPLSTAERALLTIFDTEKGYDHEAIANEFSIFNKNNHTKQHQQQTYLTINKQAPTSTEMNWDLFDKVVIIPQTLSKPTNNTFEETKNITPIHKEKIKEKINEQTLHIENKLLKNQTVATGNKFVH